MTLQKGWPHDPAKVLGLLAPWVCKLADNGVPFSSPNALYGLVDPLTDMTRVAASGFQWS
jgi:hypothetical protein